MAKDPRRQRAITQNNVIWGIVGFFDYLNTAGIYTGYLTPALMQLSAQILGLIFFPIYAINTVIYAVLAWRHAYLDRHEKTNKVKTENIIRGVINTITMVVISVAVIGGLAFAAAMGLAGILLFSLNLAMTGIYNFASGGYHLYHFFKTGKALKNPDLKQEEREKLLEKKKSHLGSTIFGFAVGTTIAMFSLGGGLALLGGFLPLAAIGIVGGILGAALCVYGLITEIPKLKKQWEERKKGYKKLDTEPESAGQSHQATHRKKPFSTTGLTQRLGKRKTPAAGGVPAENSDEELPILPQPPSPDPDTVDLEEEELPVLPPPATTASPSKRAVG